MAARAPDDAYKVARSNNPITGSCSRVYLRAPASAPAPAPAPRRRTYARRGAAGAILLLELERLDVGAVAVAVAVAVVGRRRRVRACRIVSFAEQNERVAQGQSERASERPFVRPSLK